METNCCIFVLLLIEETKTFNSYVSNVQKVVLFSKIFKNNWMKTLRFWFDGNKNIASQIWKTYTTRKSVFNFLGPIFMALKAKWVRCYKYFTHGHPPSYPQLFALGFLIFLIVNDNLKISINPSDETAQIAQQVHLVNPQAPAELRELRKKENLKYIKKYKQLAQKEMRRTGIPASIKMAQALIESRAGSSNLAMKNNNHFGIKCFSKKCKKGHCSNHTDDSHKDFFIKFKSPEDSWMAHSKFIGKSRYERLFNYGKDYKKWANGLQACGYATDKKYGSKLIRIIEIYDLHKLDS